MNFAEYKTDKGVETFRRYNGDFVCELTERRVYFIGVVGYDGETAVDLTIAYAVTHPNEQFSRKAGRELCEHRIASALSGVTDIPYVFNVSAAGIGLFSLEQNTFYNKGHVTNMALIGLGLFELTQSDTIVTYIRETFAEVRQYQKGIQHV